MGIKKVSITLIVAAYNEEKTIGETLERLYNELKKYKEFDFEILAYNDGSKDKTGEIINSIVRKYRKIIAIHNRVNMGLGNIFKDGIKKATKKKVILLPGDGQFKVDEIPYLIKSSFDTNILITYHKNYYIRTLKRRFFSFLFHKIVKVLFRIPYRYLNWLNIYDKDIFKEINIIADRFAFSAEIIIKAHKLGYKIKEVPSYLKDRETGKSSAMKVSSMAKAAFSVLKIWIDIYLKNRKKYNIKFL